MAETTTIEIDRKTHMLIKQYCVLNNIQLKDFIRNLTNERLDKFRQKIERMKEIDLGFYRH